MLGDPARARQRRLVGDLAVWCPEDIYIEEPMSLVRAYLAACAAHGVEAVSYTHLTLPTILLV